jgi:hypothetical protein
VSDLAQLQDVLGNWHDVHVFSDLMVHASDESAAEHHTPEDDVALGESDIKPPSRRHDIGLGLLALAGRLQERGRQAFAEVKVRWPNADMLIAEVESIAEQLDARHASGDGRVSENVEEEPDQERPADAHTDNGAGGAREPQERRPAAVRAAGGEEPAIREAPSA